MPEMWQALIPQDKVDLLKLRVRPDFQDEEVQVEQAQQNHGQQVSRTPESAKSLVPEHHSVDDVRDRRNHWSPSIPGGPLPV